MNMMNRYGDATMATCDIIFFIGIDFDATH